MTPNAPRTASKTWRAILAGREALKLGLIKRTGSSQSISIWEDCWLPNSATMRPMGRLKETDLVMVNELLTASNDWNEPLIRGIFFAPDVDSILSIPLRSTGGDDWLAWTKEKSGIYTVRSAYKSLIEARQSEEARNNKGYAVSSSENDTDLWRRLWKLPVVPKVRVFWWRVLRGILPDYRTLSRRHIMDNSTCALCKAESESVMHALIECSHAKKIWEAAKEILLVKLPKLHPVTWAKDILCEYFFNQHEKAIITSVMYSIWSSRNNLTHGESGFSPAKTMEMVKETLQTLELPRDKGVPKSARPECKWQRPPDGVVKINSDGAVNVNDNLAATGAVAREGVVFRGATGKTYRGVSDPLTVESLAFRDVVYARSRGFTNVVFEVDSEDLVRLWQIRANDLSVVKRVLHEISELRLLFTNFSLVHAHCEANQAAHSCAKYISLQDGSFSWDAEPPAFLVHSLGADCNLV
jgi:hypothetical protein